MERWLGRYAEIGYALMRFVAGLLFACHGAQKLFGALGGHQVEANPLMTLAGIIEFGGGVLVAIGLWAGYAAFLSSGQMAVAYFMAHAPNGFWPIRNKGELAVLYSFVFLYISMRGSGRYGVEGLAFKGRLKKTLSRSPSPGISRRVRLASAFLALFVAQAGTALAQDDPHAGCAAPPSYVPSDLLDRPVGLRTGVGNSREEVTTSSKEAQAFYDQGVNYLESYVWIEASRSFHQALRLDPKLAMAYLGLSYVQSGLENPEGATQYLESAKALAAGVTERERRRFVIREKQIAAIDDIKDAALFLAYKKAIDDALAKDLDDARLWILRGNAEETNASGRGQRGNAASIAFYQQALRLVPDHATAHHYLVHSYETIGKIDKALEHGGQYARLAPSIPHAAHMWAHDLRRVGRVDDAIEQFKKTDALERAYYAAEKIDPMLDWHHAHNLDLLASCYAHKGQVKQAEKTLRESATLGAVSAYRAFNMRELPNFLIQRGRYKEALDEARKLFDTRYPQSRSVGHALAGQALLWLGRPGEAKKEMETAHRELQEVPAMTLGIDPPRAMVEPWVEALRGEMLLRSGQREEGRAVLKEVVRALRATPGPDAWSQGLFRLESIARSAIETGDWDLAEFVAAQMLDHDKAYGGSHAVNAQVLAHKGDAAAAARAIETARGYWRDADPDLPELKQVTARKAAK